jgi:tRNA-dihydrouridine synthase B
MEIGPYRLVNNVVAAPMAGVTDRPFRELCRAWGAGLAVSEMIAVNVELQGSFKTIKRMDHQGEPGPIVVQIVGSEPRLMAEAARFNVERGAQIIDINMGCPAKKVCRKLAGSALLKDEFLVDRILRSVVAAVTVPVTLKIRTGTDVNNRNGVTIAEIAEAAGIKALAVHGRTRACKFKGEAEYETIREIKRAVSIPVIANGDIDHPQKALRVLDTTGADAVMIGRAAQGRPWLFSQVRDYFQSGAFFEPDLEQQRDTMLGHLVNLYEFYGSYTGVRIARKHISWYAKARANGRDFWDRIKCVDSAEQQYNLMRRYFMSGSWAT